MNWGSFFLPWMQNPAWACAWDPCDPNRVYTGLQVNARPNPFCRIKTYCVQKLIKGYHKLCTIVLMSWSVWQNGTLLTFDMRQTSSPLETRKGPSSTPIHTLQYVPRNARALTHEGGTSEDGGLLSASSSTLLFWPGIDQPQENRLAFQMLQNDKVTAAIMILWVLQNMLLLLSNMILVAR